MILFRKKSQNRNILLADAAGFTIVEILIAMAVCAVVAAGTVGTYMFLLKTYRGHKDFTVAHTKLRGSMALMQLDFQATGRSGLQGGTIPGGTGVTDVLRDGSGNPTVTLTSLDNDNDGNGYIDDRDLPATSTTYGLTDTDGDGLMDLMRGGQLVARGVERLGIAYAVDMARDGVVDQNPAGTGTMWCIDTNNDNRLDSHLDANLDGVINRFDDTDGDGAIDVVALGAAISLERIRQIKMWILVRSNLHDDTHRQQPVAIAQRQAYVAGDTVMYEPGDGFRRRVITVGVTLRNTEDALQF